MRKLLFVSIAFLLSFQFQTFAQYEASKSASANRQDRLRGSITPEREWWDLQQYHLSIEFFPEKKRIKGTNVISFKTLKSGDNMQIDLQEPLQITNVKHGKSNLKFEREGNVYWIRFNKPLKKGVEDRIKVFYEGTPVESKNPPWSGGITWTKDAMGNDFIATTCQGIGASIWWPNKDHGYDEPDRGVKISVTVPEKLVAVSNGRLKRVMQYKSANTRIFHWEVTNPINNYAVNVNIGNYVKFGEKFKGEGGELDMDYWVLAHHKEKAEKQFKEAPRTIKAFEHWFGKYPFYEDSFKLVEVPYLGMEHQSSVTYGNGFQNGYRGRDLSGTGVGLKFDFIVVHESGHEWFGNNISMIDSADMWIHESFTNYSENLFVEYHFSKKEAQDYVIGTRRNIKNDQPIIAAYGVNKSGSSDMYCKGGNMLHTIRQVINDDKKWRSILRGLNKEFWHKTVKTAEVEKYISEKAGMDLSKVFDQYLRTTKIPELNYIIINRDLKYHYESTVAGFAMPLRVKINGKDQWITPNGDQQTLTVPDVIETFEVDRNFYVNSKPIRQ
ncbi:MAG: M1 family metallopeptidase [Pyrinomonadaceae bacterium]|nr:M1 family metallopeptidase [Pyrinomonadaceae bacterium]